MSFYKKEGPFEFVLSNYRFIPGSEIKNGVELVTAIREINSFQQMAIMTAESNEVRRNLPLTLRYLPVLRKPFRIEELLRLLREPVLPL